MVPRKLLAAFVVAVSSSGCPADWPPLTECGTECTTGSSTGADPTPTSGTGAPTTTGTSTGGSSGTTALDTTSPGATTIAPEGPPKILEASVTPETMLFNGEIEVSALVEHADGVRMQIDGEPDADELTPSEPGWFRTTIPVVSAAANGHYTGSLTPWRPDTDGAAEPIAFDIDLAPPGSQKLWETGNLIGEGHVVALAVQPTGELVELGVVHEAGDPRCYLRRRAPSGAWDQQADVMRVLDGEFCDATDLTIDPVDGTMHVLADIKGDGDIPRWWLGEIDGWAQTPTLLGTGAAGEEAHALARNDERVAVCGAQRQLATLDLDAAAWMFATREEIPPEVARFDHVVNGPHKFSETARDCAFNDDLLVLVGEAHGEHEGTLGDRLLLIEHDGSSEDIVTVAGPGPAAQSGALALTIGDEGRYLVASYSCPHVCARTGELRSYEAGGVLTWTAPLGDLGLPGSDAVGPHDIAWSPSGQVIVAYAPFVDGAFRFKVQAFTPGQAAPSWTFLPNDGQGLQLALALAIGPFGEIYAGGVAADKFPAIAFIAG